MLAQPHGLLIGAQIQMQFRAKSSSICHMTYSINTGNSSTSCTFPAHLCDLSSCEPEVYVIMGQHNRRHL